MSDYSPLTFSLSNLEANHPELDSPLATIALHSERGDSDLDAADVFAPLCSQDFAASIPHEGDALGLQLSLLNISDSVKDGGPADSGETDSRCVSYRSEYMKHMPSVAGCSCDEGSKRYSYLMDELNVLGASSAAFLHGIMNLVQANVSIHSATGCCKTDPVLQDTDVTARSIGEDARLLKKLVEVDERLHAAYNSLLRSDSE